MFSWSSAECIGALTNPCRRRPRGNLFHYVYHRLSEGPCISAAHVSKEVAGAWAEAKGALGHPDSEGLGSTALTRHRDLVSLPCCRDICMACHIPGRFQVILYLPRGRFAPPRKASLLVSRVTGTQPRACQYWAQYIVFPKVNYT